MGFVMGSFVKPDTPGMGQATANAGQNPGQKQYPLLWASLRLSCTSANEPCTTATEPIMHLGHDWLIFLTVGWLVTHDTLSDIATPAYLYTATVLHSGMLGRVHAYRSYLQHITSSDMQTPSQFATAAKASVKGRHYDRSSIY